MFAAILWILGTLLTGVLAFLAARHRITRLTQALLGLWLVLAALMVWMALWGASTGVGDLLVLREGATRQVNRILLLIVLLYGLFGITLGLLAGWLLGKTRRDLAARVQK